MSKKEYTPKEIANRIKNPKERRNHYENKAFTYSTSADYEEQVPVPYFDEDYITKSKKQEESVKQKRKKAEIYRLLAKKAKPGSGID